MKKERGINDSGRWFFIRRWLFRWGPLFLLAYVLYAHAVLYLVPVGGPVAAVGRVVPVPLGYFEGVRGVAGLPQILWYGDVLRARSMYESRDLPVEQAQVLRWVLLSKYSAALARDIGVERVAGPLLCCRTVEQSDEAAIAVWETLVAAGARAAAEGRYQESAKVRVAGMREFLNMGIRFGDLAKQYSVLPSAPMYGQREGVKGDLPEVYILALGEMENGEVREVETERHYVFLKLVARKDDVARGGEVFAFEELGVPKQDIAGVLRDFVGAHPLRRF